MDPAHRPSSPPRVGARWIVLRWAGVGPHAGRCMEADTHGRKADPHSKLASGRSPTQLQLCFQIDPLVQAWRSHASAPLAYDRACRIARSGGPAKPGSGMEPGSSATRGAHPLCDE